MNPATLLNLLRSDQLPVYAKAKPSLSGLFRGNKITQALEPGRRWLGTTRTYFWKRISIQLEEVLQQDPVIYASTATQAKQALERYTHLTGSGPSTRQLAEHYARNEHLRGEEYRLVRYFLFFITFQKDSYRMHLPFDLFQYFPSEYHPEILMILLLGGLKAGRLGWILDNMRHFERQHPEMGAYFKEHRSWFIRFFLEESSWPNIEASAQALELLLQAEDELIKAIQDVGWNTFREDWPIDQASFWTVLPTLDEEVYFLFCQFLEYMPNSNIGYKIKQHRRFELLSGINWTEERTIRYLNFCRQSDRLIPLSKAPLQAIEQHLEEGVRAVLDEMWDYFSVAKDLQAKSVASLRKLLARYAHIRDVESADVATEAQLFASGFEPVPPKTTQNIYKGMVPDQVRPFFALLRSVADVDIIKFYQDREKNYFVRFQIKGQQFDLPTGNGLGLTLMGPLNTILYENEVPYQFVAYFRNGKATEQSYQQAGYREVRVTLVNKGTYYKWEPAILKSPIAGFAKVEEEVPAFYKRLEELAAVKLREDLDQIDLKNDPKFTALRTELDQLEPLSAWTAILTHCLRFPLDRKPTKTWQKEAQRMVDRLGAQVFVPGHVLVLDKLTQGDEWFQDTEKLAALRGLTWMCALPAESGQLYLLQKVATKAYKKIPGGPMNAKLGNLALDTLAAIGTLDAYGRMSNMEAKAKYSVFKRAIKSRKKKFKTLLEEYSPQGLADRSVPTHELKDGQRVIPVGEGQAILHLEGLKVITQWQMGAGKIQKSVPAALKESHPAEVKAVKAEAKSISETLNAQAKRLENSWLEQRKWSLADWQQFFRDHGLLSRLAARVIWQQLTPEGHRSFIWRAGKALDQHGQELTLHESAQVILWHPALASVEETLEWRNRLFEWQLKQPFKQVFREVYLLTPAEETTYDLSNRFAGHHLRGNTLYSLGKNREWTMSYDQAPYRRLPGDEMAAVLQIHGGVLYSECRTDSLVFRRLNPRRPAQHWGQEAVPLPEVPPVILSEVMRDVDLFVAVAGMGIDPYFDQSQTGDLMNYWRDASFGKKSETPLSEVRKDLLGRLLPMTKIAKQCSFAGNFLCVEGKLRNYKINLGSGNILMEPNDQYLCIVPARNSRLEKKIWLPFEGGDQTLMVILSKAFLLADDDKITASDILAQINRA